MGWQALGNIIGIHSSPYSVPILPITSKSGQPFLPGADARFFEGRDQEKIKLEI